MTTLTIVSAGQDSPELGWCSWHRGQAADVRLIHVIEQGSGPGTAARRSACAPCRWDYNLVPLANRP
ncbi:hypothetical protein [Streptomyces chartreusis]|uniref:hypothetical protein n=1 Tax=Streptomyces chartreusis TaxID=1969 RepID=UPI00381D0357